MGLAAPHEGLNALIPLQTHSPVNRDPLSRANLPFQTLFWTFMPLQTRFYPKKRGVPSVYLSAWFGPGAFSWLSCHGCSRNISGAICVTNPALTASLLQNQRKILGF